MYIYIFEGQTFRRTKQMWNLYVREISLENSYNAKYAHKPIRTKCILRKYLSLIIGFFTLAIGIVSLDNLVVCNVHFVLFNAQTRISLYINNQITYTFRWSITPSILFCTWMQVSITLQNDKNTRGNGIAPHLKTVM